jgi:hypothetical protein
MKALIIAGVIVTIVVVLLALNWRLRKHEDDSADYPRGHEGWGGSIGGPPS